MGTFLEHTLFAIAGGALPTLVWLLFWLREDRKHPEPIRLLFLTFAVGMLVVLPVLKLEAFVYQSVSGETLRILLWSTIEELGKFIAVLSTVLWRKEIDEPIDYVVYMVTVALGFAAVENTLFIFNPISQGLATTGIVTGNLRFIGATLLHIGASAAVGICMALAFYKNRLRKYQYMAFGLILAIALHIGFNLTILIGNGTHSVLASSLVWIAIIGILLLLEKVKKVHPIKN